MFRKLFLIATAMVVSNLCCNKYDYHYNVVECKEPQLMALGDRILEKLKGQRSLVPNTCYDENEKFLRVAPFTAGSEEFDARRLAGVWVHNHKTDPKLVFAGAEETLNALRHGMTWNILVDKDFAVHRYVLRNSSSGEITVGYFSEDDLMTRISNEKWWMHQDIMSCDNYLYYLSKEFGNQLVSFTVMNKYNSNDELRFIVASGGIGGYYKEEESTKET